MPQETSHVVGAYDGSPVHGNKLPSLVEMVADIHAKMAVILPYLDKLHDKIDALSAPTEPEQDRPQTDEQD